MLRSCSAIAVARASCGVNLEWSHASQPSMQSETLRWCAATASALASVEVNLERSQDCQPFLQSITLRRCSAAATSFASETLRAERLQDEKPFLHAVRFRPASGSCARAITCQRTRQMSTAHSNLRFRRVIGGEGPFLLLYWQEHSGLFPEDTHVD